MSTDSGIENRTFPYGDPQVTAAAIYCSDGRFASQTEAFVQHRLGIAYFDRISVPGGPAKLAGPGFQPTAFETLMFLIEAHSLKRLIMVAHDDCGFYQQGLQMDAEQMEVQQISDLTEAVERVRQAAPQVEVMCYIACRSGDDVTFEPLEM